MSISIVGIEDIQQSVLRLSNQTEQLIDGLGDTVQQVNTVLGNVSQDMSDVIESMNGTLVEMTGLLRSLTNSSEVLILRVDWTLQWTILVILPLLTLVFCALSVCLVLYGIAKLRKAKMIDKNSSVNRASARPKSRVLEEPRLELKPKSTHLSPNQQLPIIN